MTYYDAVKAAAEAAGTSVNNVEEKAGLAKGTIGKWKKGEPRIGSLEKVARVLNADINELVAAVRGRGL